ncbi:hypothetical protein F2Q70_00001011 [Brassica cretica]|nr:hypothetical protein F2Q70_00001011 [Brassica cretica]
MYILCYAPQDLVIEDSQEVVSFSSAHWLLYFGNIHLLDGIDFCYWCVLPAYASQGQEASTASPSSPNSLLLVALEIHLVSPVILIDVRADLTRLLNCLATSRSSSDN